MDLEAKIRDVIELLSQYRSYYSPFGGALAPEDSHIRTAEYGPAGLIFAGSEFDSHDRRRIVESLEDVHCALVLLRSERGVIAQHSNGDPITGVSAWASLIEPYLADPADPSVVEDWRLKAQRGYVGARRFIERHDAAIAQLAFYLGEVDLYVVYARRMSEREETEVENENAAIYAVVKRLVRGGLRLRAAMEQAAEDFRVDVGAVERIYEFRHTLKKPKCADEKCDRPPVAQNLCMRHYQQVRRALERHKAS